jgi:hypothetical protein
MNSYSDNSDYRYSDTDIFLSNTNINMIFNLESNTDTNMNTDNYSDPNIFEIRISR